MFENEEVYYTGERDPQGVWFGEGKLVVKIKYKDTPGSVSQKNLASEPNGNGKESDKDQA